MLSTLLRKPVRIDLATSQPRPATETLGLAHRDVTDEPTGLSREQLIDRIIALNPSATSRFLDQFDDEALNQYLNHLSLTTAPRGRETRWIRPSGHAWAFANKACA